MGPEFSQASDLVRCMYILHIEFKRYLIHGTLDSPVVNKEILNLNGSNYMKMSSENLSF